jgi:hypothetical protein
VRLYSALQLDIGQLSPFRGICAPDRTFSSAKNVGGKFTARSARIRNLGERAKRFLARTTPAPALTSDGITPGPSLAADLSVGGLSFLIGGKGIMRATTAADKRPIRV